ncbi:MAG: hypothetical protein JWN74_259 [Acidobacteriaceae bacterium]|nr:hypothetical protein [Acidobacteriaceae bacterium]
MSLSDKIEADKIQLFFEASHQRVFWPSDFIGILRRYKSAWNVPRRVGIDEFAEWILKNSSMQLVELKSPHYDSIKRYVWGKDVAAETIALSTKRGCYLSHGSALWAHGLGGSEQQIYVNHEQREKPPNDSNLTQEAIDRAFQNQPRHTKSIYKLGECAITILNGKNTNRRGVKRINAPGTGALDVTSLERTLIDVAVRPQYAGGVCRVLDAFIATRDRISVPRLARDLEALDYTYPYHQAIGFYLKCAGYSAKDQRLFSRISTHFDFYLCYGMSKPLLDPEWRVYYPSDLRERSGSRAAER